MRLSKEQTVGLFFLGGVVLFAVFIEITVGTGIFRRRYTLAAEFRDVQGLTVGSDVRVAGVASGTVREVALEKDKVRIELAIDHGIEVHRDAVARLDFQALSGTRFVSIDPGSPDAPPLAAGSTLRTEEPAGISEMVRELQGVASSVRGLAESLNENQDRLLRNVNTMVEENRQSVQGIFAHLNGVTEKLASGEGTLGRLLADSRLYDEAVVTLQSLNASFGDIRRITGDVHEVTSRLARGDGLLGRMLRDDELYDDLRETMASLEVTAENVESISDQVRTGEGTLGKLLNEDDLYLEAADAVRGLTRATQGIEDQAPISVLGTFIGTVF
jgi:phospholipid/cholesterol/gamma-HCH transport system substrate-binding protein